MTTLRLVEVEKRFGSLVAVTGASVTFEPGRIHAVVGENGAGKSTLLRVAAGTLAPDAGHVEIDGVRLAPHTAAQAIARGVGMVEQHFLLIDALTVLDNAMLGVEPTRGVRLDRPAAARKLDGVLAELGATLDTRARVAELGVGERQRLEIARVLFRDARVVILDEPTAVLTPQEAEALYATLRKLAAAGRAVVVVTHKLDEVYDHAEAVTVLRRGRLIETRPVHRGTRAEDMRALGRDVMGAEAPEEAPTAAAPAGETVLAVNGLACGRALRGVTLSVARGEIVGVAGVEGNGQRELVHVLAGLVEATAGEVRASAPVAVVHEDRQEEGLVLDASLFDNALLGDLARFARGGLLAMGRAGAEAERRLRDGGVRPRDLELPAVALSGGNQQKIVVERAMARADATRGAAAAGVLVLAHPTRGVDLGAARAIRARVRAAAAAGAGVLVFGADLDELRVLCHRILVIARGRIAGELPPSASNEAIGALMLAGAATGGAA